LEGKIMKKNIRKQLILLVVILLILPGLFGIWQTENSGFAQVLGNDVLYTTDADFDQGTLLSVNHDTPYNDQLQLDSPTKPFPFINVAASGRGTVVRANTETGEILGEYRTAPEGRGLNPSRTTVDLFGSVWTANREETDTIDGVPHGSAVKIGLIVGGTQVNASGVPDPIGGYLAPPYDYNTCVDRDNDGLIRTSQGLLDILDWPDNSDGQGGADGLVEDAEDECILIYQRLYDAEAARHVSVDADNNVWVGGFPNSTRMFYKLDGSNGAILDSFDAREIGCGGYGGLIDGNGVIWSVGGALLRYDPDAHSGLCIDEYGYGLGIDTNGYIWMSIWDGGIVKIAPDGTIMPGYPKPIYPPSMMTTSLPPSSQMLELSSPEADDLVLNEGAAQPTSVNSNWSEPSRQLTDFRTPMMETLLEIQVNGESATFQVAPTDDWIRSTSTWTPDAAITLTIEDGSGVLYSDMQTADGDGNFFFGLWDVFDIQRGHVVTISNGTTTKTHIVTNLFVNAVNVTADTVSGLADPGTKVDIWVHGDGDLTVTTDISGNWTADFGGISDLTYFSDGGSQQVDTDGDSTWVWWTSPRFQVAPVDDWIEAWSPWTPDATITLTIEDGSGVVYADSQTSNSEGGFKFHLWDKFDIHRGHDVTISDGTTTKTHTVTNLYVDSINVIAETISGRADAGSDVFVWVHGNGDLDITTDSTGTWTADFSGMTDLTYLSDGGSQQMDEEGDFTGVWWASPRFQVAPEDDWVESSGTWSPGATITLTIEDGSVVVYSDSQTANSNGYFHFGLWDVFNIQRGHVVTISDGTNTKTHTVTNLYVDGVNFTDDDVFGRADAGTDVEVWVHGNGNLITTADSSGNWTADFSGMDDLTYISDGGSQQKDTDGDSTGVWWASPRFQVSPDDDWIGSWSRWTPGATIYLTIEDGTGVIYSDSQTSDIHGNFSFNLWDVFDIQRGHLVTVSDGVNTKTHTVTNLFVDGFDVTADTVFGRAHPGSNVAVRVNGDGNLTVTADGSGDWTANFSGMTNLTYQSNGGSQQMDDDGDFTNVGWAMPSFQVWPEDNWIESWNRWAAGVTVNLIIEDGGIQLYSGSQITDAHGFFNFNAFGSGVLDTGHLVIISDGTTTKTHTVTGITITDIDTDTDKISGIATNPDARVEVWVNLFNEGSGRTVFADSTGAFTADFSVTAGGQPIFDITNITRITAREFDDDNDLTNRQFGPPSMGNRGVAVTATDNNVWVANSGYDTVTRLDNDGNILKVIDSGVEPTGVAVDADGKVWATNMGSRSAIRIDPNADVDGLGAIDLTIDLGLDSWPYNYSDMTGAVVIGSTSPQGFWSVMQDSGTSGFEWGRIVWNTEPEGNEPTGSAIIVEARAADTEAGLGGQPFLPVLNGNLFSMFGRFIEVRVTLKASPGGESPVLSDIRIQPHVIYVSLDIKPESCPNPLSIKDKGVLPVAIMGTEDFDVTQIDPETIRLFRYGVPDPTMVAPLHWSLEDAGIPYEPLIGKIGAYDCVAYYPDEFGAFDGFLDLSFKFKAKEVLEALGEINNGDVIVLQLSGKLKEEFGGIDILGEDVIWILGK
jgi:hypothetical protein